MKPAVVPAPSPAPAELESLSCLMDAELSQIQTQAWIDRLCRDEAARAEWSALHCASDALHSNEVAAWHSAAFAARVAQAIEAEPYLLAPGKARMTPRWVRRVLLPGAATAAAAVVLAVLVVPQINAPESGTGAPQLALQATPARAPASAAMAVAAGGMDDEVWRAADLERLLSAHRELAAGTLMPSAPYLRTASEVPPTAR